MFIGIVSGLLAAVCNSAGYLFNARFLLYYKSPWRLLITSSVIMMLISIPLLAVFFPWGVMGANWRFWFQAVLTGGVFFFGQWGFFGALKHAEASRVAPLLGLKIAVISIFFLLGGNSLNLLQIIALFTATFAALLCNWAGDFRIPVKAWLFISVTLCSYCMVDILETDLIMQLERCTSWSRTHSALVTVPAMYTVVGALAVPGIFILKPQKDEYVKAAPYGLLWIMAQFGIFCCFAFLQPVFGNVILATRGVWSVVIGAILPFFGLAALDSKLSAMRWVQRGVAAALMAGAIALYSFASI